ncbi:hypothetical protein QBC41DRAFT_313257 [Cercophora samala]|uniref:Uncharacterized protein n=1 Tax=Cercophora samala TaxID=330535 RepID=A0AA39ZKI9_9PEZI|nr:hypothetical protein QBC41DRAFT_313257 [Cercophora samala]
MISPVLHAGGMLAKRAVSNLADSGITVYRRPTFSASASFTSPGGMTSTGSFSDMPDEPQGPPIKWAPYGGLQLFINFLAFLPVFLYIFYTLAHIYPTLAIVEDPLPAYDAIPIHEPTTDDDNINKANKNARVPNFTNGASSSSSTLNGDSPLPTKPITSSLRATHRTLQSISGFRSQFRGLGCALFLSFATSILSGIFSFLPILGNLAVLLLTSQLMTALTHIIISHPRPANTPHGRTFFSRLPPWRRNLVATYQPILFYWVSIHAAILLPGLLAGLIGLSPYDDNSQLKDGISGVEVAQLVCVLGVFLGLNLLLVVPAHVALVRVQATLLPHDDETIVPFDRTFGGSVEPEVINGKGFGSLRNALGTVSWASWVRLYVQQAKILGVTLGLYAAVGAVLAFEFLFLGWRV